MEVTQEQYLESAKVSIRRLSRLSDYQEQHIAALEQELKDAREVIARLQAEGDDSGGS